eukprot:g33503.t1
MYVVRDRYSQSSAPRRKRKLSVATRPRAQVRADRAFRKSAVPVNLLMLGSNLSRGAEFSTLPMCTAVVLTITKMLIQPALVAFWVFCLARMELGPNVKGKWLVAIVVSLTPTANNIMVQVELGGQDKKAMTALIFTQYLMAPVLLTISLTATSMLMQVPSFLVDKESQGADVVSEDQPQVEESEAVKKLEVVAEKIIEDEKTLRFIAAPILVRENNKETMLPPVKQVQELVSPDLFFISSETTFERVFIFEGQVAEDVAPADALSAMQQRLVSSGLDSVELFLQRCIEPSKLGPWVGGDCEHATDCLAEECAAGDAKGRHAEQRICLVAMAPLWSGLLGALLSAWRSSEWTGCWDI